MAFYYSKRKLRPAEEEEGGELNIVPYLDILMNLIIFMLLSMTGLAVFGVLNVTAPNYGGPSAGVTDDADKPKLTLSVLISKDGFFVAGAGAVLGEGAATGQAVGNTGAPTVPKKNGDYDYAALQAIMVRIKHDYPTESHVIIGAEATTNYEYVIETMDAVRETGSGASKTELFPEVTLAAM